MTNKPDDITGVVFPDLAKIPESHTGHIRHTQISKDESDMFTWWTSPFKVSCLSSAWLQYRDILRYYGLTCISPFVTIKPGVIQNMSVLTSLTVHVFSGLHSSGLPKTTVKRALFSFQSLSIHLHCLHLSKWYQKCSFPFLSAIFLSHIYL